MATSQSTTFLTNLENKIPPPAIMIICALGVWFTAETISLTLFATDGSWHWSATLAVIIFACGVVIDLISLKRFFAAKTTINPLKPQQASSLVTTGIYRFTRNPMYLGLMLWLAALAIYLNNPLALIWPVIFVVYINRFQITPEERFLKTLFGEPYLAYLQNTPRWLLLK